MGTWGHELGDGSNIFWMTYFQNIFFYDSKPLIFSYLHGSVGQGYCLFLDSIILIGRERGDGSMVAGEWRWEQSNEKIATLLKVQ